MYSHKKTKIVATIGPATEDVKVLKRLLKHGVNVFRFNMKHVDVDWHRQAIKKALVATKETNIPAGILIDLQGPEIRVRTRDSKDYKVKRGNLVRFSMDFEHPETVMCVTDEHLFDALEAGDKFSMEDGFVQFKVEKKVKGGVIAKLLNDSVIKDRKTLNLYGKDVNMPSLTKEDKSRILLAKELPVDFIALSFVRTKKDLDALKSLMKKLDIKAKIVSKIETQLGIDNIDELIAESDAIMIARGDLGVEAPMEKLAYYQKMIISKCRSANKPVIVATQMLDSMISNPVPTRAEATDVANAVLDGTDAVMLSGETSLGKYPVEAVNEMAKIVDYNEEKSTTSRSDDFTNPTELIVKAAQMITRSQATLQIDHIIVLTETGYTARVLSSFRPETPILAITDEDSTAGVLTLSYGIEPVVMRMPDNKLLKPHEIVQKLRDLGGVSAGENVLMIHGQHWKQPGQTNSIVLVNVK